MKTIVVAVDFSSISENLIAVARQIATPKTAIYLIHVAAPDPDFVGYSVGPQHIRDERAKQLREEHKMLNEYKDALRTAGFQAEGLLVQGPTTETLLQEIEKLAADMLIIGKKGHSSLYEVLIGSVCTDVLKHLTIPALVVPATINNS